LVVKPNRPPENPSGQINEAGPETQAATQTLSRTQAPDPPESLIFGVFRSILEPSIVKPPELRTSTGIEQGTLIHRVEPSYPLMARSSHIQGAVVLEATISRDGSVRAVRPVTGNALLMNSAVIAVKQWRYTPYKLNGQPLDVQTRITLNFALP
jgi:TonB family protein